MAQRHSGYARKERDHYPTPAWVTKALLPYIPGTVRYVWEPACGEGSMTATLSVEGYVVRGTDVVNGHDFLTTNPDVQCDAIITNPPFKLAQKFIERSLGFIQSGFIDFVAMLLPAEYDYAHGRRHLFGEHRAFSQKITLTKRIVWFERPGAAPSSNHAWFTWDRRHIGYASLEYAP